MPQEASKGELRDRFSKPETKDRSVETGLDASVTVVTDVRKSGDAYQKRTRTLSFSKGKLAHIGKESGWVSIG